MCLRALPPKPIFLLNLHKWFFRNRLTLRAPAFRCWNGFIYCSADSSNNKVSILIYILNRLKLGNITWAQCHSRVDSNTSLLVWLNLYVMGLVCMFLWGWASIEISMGRWSLPKSSPIRNRMSCLIKLGDMNAMSKMSVLPVLLSRWVCSSVFK